jgi:hypothetical protein
MLCRISVLPSRTRFAEYHEKSDSFQAHEAILEVAAGLMAGSPAALALVATTLKALQKMDQDSPWITLFNRESHSAKTARFQIGLAEEDAADGLLLSLTSFGLEARSNVTQVLFFKFRSNDVTLQHHSGKVTINAAAGGGAPGDRREAGRLRARV